MILKIKVFILKLITHKVNLKKNNEKETNYQIHFKNSSRKFSQQITIRIALQ
jgi:hypothetical protein